MQFRIVVGMAGVAAVAVLTGACASTGATPRPFPMPGGGPSAPASAGRARPAPAASKPDAYAITGTALSLRGSPYRNGGGDPSGFDCSGFTQYVFAQHDVALPREVREQYRVGQSVKPQDLSPGDIVFFATTDRKSVV